MFLLFYFFFPHGLEAAVSSLAWPPASIPRSPDLVFGFVLGFFLTPVKIILTLDDNVMCSSGFSALYGPIQTPVMPAGM